MNGFQTLVLGVLGVLAALTLSAGLRGTVRKRVVVLGLVAWSLGAVAALWPEAVAWVAQALGVRRGADLLLYVTVLATMVALFCVYVRFRRVERQLTVLVRRLAIQNAQVRGSAVRSSMPSDIVRRSDTGRA